MSTKIGKGSKVEITDQGNVIGRTDMLSEAPLEKELVNKEWADNNYVGNGFAQKSAIYTLTSLDNIIECTANTFTITLPTAVGIAGKQYVIKNSGSGVITVDGDGSQTIDDELTQALNQYDSITIVSNNTNWIII